MNKYILISLLTVGVALPGSLFAKSGVINTDARMRSGASTGHGIIQVLHKGTIVDILQESHGWYQIRDPFGAAGWTAAWLIDANQTSQTSKQIEKRLVPKAVPIVTKTTSQQASSGSFLYNSRIRAGNSTAHNILTVAKQGSTVTILEEKKGWYKVKTANGLVGWTATWLVKKTTSHEVKTTSEKTSNTIVIEPKQSTDFDSTIVSNAPADVDELELNRYWFNKINALRKARGLRLLVLDDRWKATASQYAKYMGETQAKGHERADGSSMHQWIDTKGLDFTTRYSAGGWKTNYFTENISWGIAKGTTEDVKRVLDNTLDFYLGEASYNGAHYRTIYHPDWNSVGSGFHFTSLGNGTYRVSTVFHYGSLEL